MFEVELPFICNSFDVRKREFEFLGCRRYRNSAMKAVSRIIRRWSNVPNRNSNIVRLVIGGGGNKAEALE